MSNEYTKFKDIVETTRRSVEQTGDARRKSRSRLYIASLTTITVFVTNAIPTKIDALGISIEALEAQRILPFLSLVSLYFLVLFALRELQYESALTSKRLATKQFNSKMDLLDEEAWRRKFKGRDSLWLLIGDIAQNIGTVILIAVPTISGITASAIGWWPESFGWLKHAFRG